MSEPTTTSEVYEVTDDQVREFHERGFIVLRGVFTPEELQRQRSAFQDYVMGKREEMSAVDRALGASSSKPIFSYGDAPEETARFVTSPRLGAIVARFLRTDAVRLLHLCGFFKPGGGPGTPWHQDLSYIPLDTAKSLTVWIPLVDVTPDMGSLVFAEGSHHDGPLNPMRDTDRFSQVANGSMEVGDISLHFGWTLHSSSKNSSDQMREVIAMGYYADGARIATRPPIPITQNMMESLFTGLATGDLAASPMTPRVFPPQATEHSGPARG